MTTTEIHHELRRLIALSSKISTVAATEPGPRQLKLLVEDVEKALIDIGTLRGRSSDPLTPMRLSVNHLMDRLEKLYPGARIEGGQPDNGKSNGAIALDVIFRQLSKPGNLSIVSGVPGVGKTAFALDVVKRVALEQRRSVAIFSMRHQSAMRVTERLLSSFGTLEIDKLHHVQFGDYEWDRLTLALAYASESDVRIFDAESVELNRLQVLCHEMHRSTEALGLVVIDDLQCIHHPQNGNGEGAEAVLQSIKNMALDLAIPVVAVSNLYPCTGNHVPRRPQLSDLVDREAISQFVDMVLLLHRNEVSAREFKGLDFAEVTVAHNRDGANGAALLLFDTKHLTFREPTQANWSEYLGR